MQFDKEVDPWGRMYQGDSRSAPLTAPKPGTGVALPPPAPVAPAQEEFVAPFAYSSPAYGGASRPTYNLPGVPQFDAPDFAAPDPNGIYADPSFQYRLKQSLGGLDASAAARGTLRTGGHLLGIQGKAGEMASQEYASIFDRAMQDYQTKYRGAYDEFAPKLQDYQNRFGAATDAGNRGFDRDWQRYQFPIDDEFRREQLLANLGLPGE